MPQLNSLFLNRTKFGKDRLPKKRKRVKWLICTFCSEPTCTDHAFVVQPLKAVIDNQGIIFVGALNKIYFCNSFTP